MRSIVRAVLVVAVVAGGVRAAPAGDDEPDLQARWAMLVPPSCTQFIPPNSSDDPRYWDRWLSLASCLYRPEGPKRVVHPFDLHELVEDLTLELRASMLMWQRALDRAPLDVQLRAAFHVGLAATSLITRARGSLAAPVELTGFDAVARETMLRRRLEPLLAPSKRVAWTAFSAISDHAAEHPEYERDPVARHMVRFARTWLQRPDHPAEQPILAETSQPVRVTR